MNKQAASAKCRQQYIGYLKWQRSMLKACAKKKRSLEHTCFNGNCKKRIKCLEGKYL